MRRASTGDEDDNDTVGYLNSACFVSVSLRTDELGQSVRISFCLQPDACKESVKGMLRAFKRRVENRDTQRFLALQSTREVLAVARLLRSGQP